MPFAEKECSGKRTTRSLLPANSNGSYSLTLVGWKDNKAVYFSTSRYKQTLTVKVDRYCSNAKKKILINQQACISNYNKAMTGVDQNVPFYRILVLGKKWWCSLFAWALDVALQNSWILYKTFKSNNEPSLDLLNF